MKITVFILILLTIISTAIIGIKKPSMHSRIMVYDSQYTIVDDSKAQVEEKIISEEMPTMPAETTTTRTQVLMEEQPETTSVEEVKTAEQPKNTQKQNVVKKETKSTPKQQVKTDKNVNTVSKPETKTTVQTATKPETKKVTQAVATPTTTKAPTTTTTKVLTEQEEIIAWNKWRSNLQNQLMKDSKLPVLPMGTIFKVSFDVDKYGKITNVQTWSTNSKYTPYAIEFIAPVIRSYQGKSIVEFPAGSKRTNTTFTGGWKISQNEKYSSPSDYNDLEKVTK